MTKKLFDILPDEFNFTLVGAIDIMIKDIQIDSRKVQKGDVYVALVGTRSDGHQFIDDAIDRGAVCVICQNVLSLRSDVTYIQTQDVRTFLGDVMNLYYEHPTDKMMMVGVTGTNGKTSVATLLYQLFCGMGYQCGLISTVSNRIGNEVLPSEYTTPDIVSLFSLLFQMEKAGCTHVFMEVSSHALDQKRVAGIRFKGAVFTNITHDHLDYHGNMKNYIVAKKLLFDGLDKSAFALVNADDKNGEVMWQNCKAQNKKTFGLKSWCDFKGKIIESSLSGLHIKINDQDAYFRMIGEFNAYNLLAVYGAALLLGAESDEVLKVLSGLSGAEGRFEVIRGSSSSKTGIVDYAHTPDALEKVLLTLHKIRMSSSQIITVVGCGGDRDKEKRPEMARIACMYSDKVIMTSDNPRSENPEDILNDMEKGLSTEDLKKVLRVTDRHQAIKTSVMMSGENDIILVAGKGHEKYQEIQGIKIPFDDKEILATLLS